MNRARFRTGIALIAAGGVVFAVASLKGGDAVYGAAIALVAIGLAVHLSDPVARARPLMAIGLGLGVAAALLDSVLTFAGRDGPVTTGATVALLIGVALAVAGRRLA